MKHVDYDSLVPPAGYGAIMTRNASTSQCQCSVCQVGRLNGVNYILYKEKVSEPVGRPRVYPPTEPESIQLCNVCLCSWSRGQEHKCNRESKIQNLQNMVRSSSPRSKEKVLSSQLKEVFQEKGVPTKGGSISLTTKGTPLTTTLGN